MRLEGQFVAPWLHLTRNVDTPAMCCPPSEKLVYNKPTATSSIYPTVIGIMFTINLAYEISFKSALNPIWNPHFSSVFLVKAPCSSKNHHLPIGFSIFSSKNHHFPSFSHRIFSVFLPSPLHTCSCVPPWSPGRRWPRPGLRPPRGRWPRTGRRALRHNGTRDIYFIFISIYSLFRESIYIYTYMGLYGYIYINYTYDYLWLLYIYHIVVGI